MNSRKFYLEALSTLYVLMPTTEYDNARPRSVRLYFRDPGLVTALTGGDPTAVLEDRRREAELARLVAFDHTMRFAYGVNASQGTERTSRSATGRPVRGPSTSRSRPARRPSPSRWRTGRRRTTRGRP